MEKEKRKDHCHIQWAKKLCGLSFFVISPIYSIKYIIYHITILIIHKVFLSFCIFVPSITLSPANLDFWPIPNVEPQQDGDDETND
jgi:hypothetical protein